MISHVVLGDVAAERSAMLRLQAEEFRRAKKADSARTERNRDAGSRMPWWWWRRGISRHRSLEPAIDPAH
jgi:hypothetical protein